MKRYMNCFQNWNRNRVTRRDKQQDAALVFFVNRLAAASAAQSLHAQLVDTWTTMDAPEQRQLIWTNLKIKFFQRKVRHYVVYIIVTLTILFYMIPIGFISAFTTLDNLKKLLPFLNSVVDVKAIKTVLEAYLPQIALIVFLAMLSKLLLFLSKAEGIPSESHAVRAASGKYFYFTVLNVFIGVTVGGTLFSTLKNIEKDPNSVVTLLAISLPANATFFLTFVALILIVSFSFLSFFPFFLKVPKELMLHTLLVLLLDYSVFYKHYNYRFLIQYDSIFSRFFVGYGLELSRIVPLIIFHLKKKYLCKTEAEVKEAWSPGDLGYVTRVPGDMLIVIIVLCYSVIAPLIIPFGVVYFGLGWLVLRNQALKVYVPAYESYGRMWPHMHTRILASLILYQVTMFGFFLVKEFYYAPFLIPLPILSLLFGYTCSHKFYRFFRDTALEVACRPLKEVPNMDQVFKAFIPPSLSSEKIDDDQFEDALSQVSRTGSFV